jgi:hypothetical protein
MAFDFKSVAATLSCFLAGLAVSGQAVARGPAPLPLFCAASGTKMLDPLMTEAVVCDRFGAAVSKAINAPVETRSASLAAGRTKGNWAQVTLHFAKPAIVTLSLTTHRDGRSTLHPTQSMAVTDRALAANDVDQMAKLAAKMLVAVRR